MPPEELRSHAEYLRKAFEREARLVRGLKHHALPSVIDYFTTGDGHQFFVMDFIPGKDFGELLDERLRQNHRPFPLDQTLDWADQLLDALDYLHTRFESPIVHRDLKPLNLKLIPDGQIVLLDFGLAKGATPGMSVVSASNHGYTLQYAPLEQIRGKGTSVRSDLYSLAVTLHHLLSGAPPPSAVDRVAETTSGEADPLRPLHEVNPQIPAVISEVIQRAAALNPNERYATAAEMHEALLKAMQPARHPQPQPPLPPVKEQETIQRDRRFKVDLAATRRTVQPSGNRWKWAAVGGALVLVIGLGIAVSSRHLFSNGSSSTSAKRSSEPAPTVAAPTTPPSPNVKPAPALQSFTENLGNGVKLEMVAIRGGTFEMGSPDGQGLDKGEYPKHSVTVSPFAIGKYEVTQGQWKAVMGSNNFAIMHIDPRSNRGGDNLPVSSVSWN
jgi:serine/threonine protein kinase